MKFSALLVSLAAPLALLIAVPASAADNTLTAQEKSAGWQLLFDGSTFNGWRGYRLKGVPPVGWNIDANSIHTIPSGKYVVNPDPNKQGVELITEKKFTDYELSWDWRIAPGGNNGIKYMVTEDRPEAPGPEYQMLDDTGDAHRDWRGKVHRTAAFYDIAAPADDKPMKPAGEWNNSRIVVKGQHIEHWLNGKKVLSIELGSPQVKAGLQLSKFKDQPGFGDKITGHIMLTYQPHECWYRNIKLREL
jgi:hypothetical protein